MAPTAAPIVTDVLDPCDERRSVMRLIWSWRDFAGAAEVEVLAKLRYVHHGTLYVTCVIQTMIDRQKCKNPTNIQTKLLSVGSF